MKKEERAERKSRSLKGKQDNRFLFQKEEYGTSTDDDEGTTISDEDGYGIL